MHSAYFSFSVHLKGIFFSRKLLEKKESLSTLFPEKAGCDEARGQADNL